MPLLFHEFAKDKRLLWIAREWARYSDQLADWALKRLANRRDTWSQYTLRHGQIGVVMLPIKELRKKGAEMVTHRKLKRHFTGAEPNHLIGLHSISDHSTCKWFAIDIDLHDESVINAADVASANLEAALIWAERIRADGLDPLVIDSNGVGGYHLWVLLDREYPLARTFDYADSIRANWESLGLPRRPEQFPPKREVDEDDLPYTLRLPGRHHTRRYYSRVRNFEAYADTEWLEGGDAIEAMLAIVPGRLPAAKRKTKTVGESVKEKRRSVKKRKPRVCVDLDGVLAKYNGYKGPDKIGEPLPGAIEFAKKLSEIADIVIFTTRCSEEPDPRRGSIVADAGQARTIIADWLDEHEIPYVDVYVGRGKPRAAAFVDDRAVPCRPQEDNRAYDDTFDSLQSLIGSKRKPARKN